MDVVLDIVRETWAVTAAMAPYLLLGFAVAGILSVVVSPRWLEAQLGGGGPQPVWKAALFGVPLPLCSCGVIPVAASLRRHGASRGATTAFLLSTPQTGVDSIAVTYSILGPLMALLRPLTALVTGLVGGGIVQVTDTAADGDRWTDGEAEPAPPQDAGGKLRAAWQYGLVTLPRDIGNALAVGVVIAGVLSALIPPDYLAAYFETGPLAILVMMAVGIPLYVCATGSVPIAAAFVHMGVSPGAALAFLIAGPATNAAAFTTVWRVLGRGTSAIYLGVVAVSAFGSGLLLDALAPRAAQWLPVIDHQGHELGAPGWFEQLCGVVLVLVLANAFRSRRGHACACETATEPPAEAGAGRQVALKVDGMSCSHCRDSVARALSEVAGVADVEVDLAGGTATVRGDDLDAAVLAERVGRLGYETVVVGED
jgi:uncharacterized membrane protein YraQ (UPF0718 family)/copper chaperone CopZ